MATSTGVAVAFTDKQLRDLTHAACTNARDLLHEAEFLARAGHYARAVSLGILALEEAGKSLIALNAISNRVIGRRDEQHEQLVTNSLKYHPPKLQEIREPLDLLRNTRAIFEESAVDKDGLIGEYGQINLDKLTAYDPEISARELNALKQDGFYVGMSPEAQLREPSEISLQQAAEVIVKARMAIELAIGLQPPEVT